MHRAEKERLDALLEGSRDVIAVLDRDGVLVYVSPSAPDVFGFEQGSNLGTNALSFVHDDDRERVGAALTERSVTTEPREPLRLQVAHHDGSWRHIEVVATNMLDDPRVGGIVVNVRDVTEREHARLAHEQDAKRARDEALATARLYEAMLANLSDLVSIIDADGKMRYLSPAAERVVGRRAEDRMGKSIFEYLHPDDRGGALTVFKTQRGTPGVFGPVETRLLHADGTYHTFELITNNLLSDPDVRGVIISSRDVTQRVQAEAALRERERLYRSIVETANEGIWLIDADDVTTFVNPRMAEMLGVTPETMIGRRFWDFLDSESRDATAQRIDRRRRGIREQHDFRFTRADGADVWAMLSATPIMDDSGTYAGAVALVTDVTERRATEAELRRAETLRAEHETEVARHRLEVQIARVQRLESLHRLAAGIAHDFNNLLGIIGNYSQVVARQIDPDGPLAHDVAMIQDAAGRANDFTAKLRALDDADCGQPELIEINRAVVEITDLVRGTIDSACTVIATLTEPCHVFIDRGHFTQILLNLVLNASDAIAGGGTVEVTVTRENRSTDGRHTGPRAVLTVRDDGAGMTSDVQRRAFEPFFTTKPPSQGSGLGLATVHALVTRSGGSVVVHSQPGAGATVVVDLPEAPAPTGDGAP